MTHRAFSDSRLNVHYNMILGDGAGQRPVKCSASWHALLNTIFEMQRQDPPIRSIYMGLNFRNSSTYISITETSAVAMFAVLQFVVESPSLI